MMLIRRIKCDLLTMMAMAILVTHSATETEARPQLQHQPQQPAHSEEAFFPEPSVHYLANGYPHLVRTYYNYPLFDRKRLRMQQMQRAWNYEDPENYLIDSFMSAIADGHIKQHQTTTTTTTIKPTTTSTSKDAKTPVKITLLPFYGGAKGQTLQITENLDGTVSTEVLQGQFPAIEPEGEEEEAVEVVENPVLPVRRESDYGQNIKNIHRSALNIIRLQEAAKNKGLNQEEEAAYKEYMDSLNQSAHNLAKIYEGDEDDSDAHTRAGLSGWFARKKPTTPPKKENKDKDKDKDKKKEEENKKKQVQTSQEEMKKKEEEAKKKAAEEAKKKAEEAKKKADADAKRKAEEEAKKKLEEENKKKQEQEQQQQQQAEEDEETPQQPETSVAEAKPVGLAVAGIGGVASSKPVATAVVGPGGLAIARPVGTAIAGVSPDQALVPIYAEGFVMPKPSATKDKKPSHSTDYLNKIISKYHQV